jgi:chromate transporter
MHDPPPQPTPDPSRVGEVAALFTRLGFTAFGGPAAHVAMIEDEVVGRRKWIDRQHFLDLLASTNFVPGPNSTELTIHLGLIRAGTPGLLAAGICFITPAVLIILPIAWTYVAYGALPEVSAALRGINACVVSIVAAALTRFARTAIVDRFTLAIAVLAIAAAFLLARFPSVQPELIVLGASALLGAFYYGRPKLSRNLAASLLPLAVSLTLARNLLRMCLLFLKVGATLFGSGYVLVTYLRTGLVDQLHWLTPQQLLDAIAVGQVTPGPLLTTATFIGYVLGHQKFGGGVAGGIIGAVLATVSIFLPSFLFIAILGRMLPRIRRNRFARGALSAMNAAVVALILVVTLRLAAPALFPQQRPDPFNIILAAASLAAILKFRVNSTWLIIVCGLLGALHGA